MDEYRLKVTIKNNLILNAIEESGHTNLHNFCKSEKLQLNNLYDLINLRPFTLLLSQLYQCENKISNFFYHISIL